MLITAGGAGIAGSLAEGIANAQGMGRPVPLLAQFLINRAG
jgi:hypothetical protein